MGIRTRQSLAAWPTITPRRAIAKALYRALIGTIGNGAAKRPSGRIDNGLPRFILSALLRSRCARGAWFIRGLMTATCGLFFLVGADRSIRFGPQPGRDRLSLA